VKLASLFENRYFENLALSTCAQRHFETTCFGNLTSLLIAVQRETFDAVILEDNAREIGHWLSALQLSVGDAVPVIVFGEGGKVGISRALQRGADDYASHCSGPEGLLSRVEARVSVRLNKCQATQLQVGTYLLDTEFQCVRSGKIEVNLTAREFSLTWMLFENLGQVVTFKMLSAEIWGYSADIAKRTIEQHVYKLRRKFSDAAILNSDIPCIQTVYGVGYRLVLQKSVFRECADEDDIIEVYRFGIPVPIYANV
jgi:DNA-binding response OmpR family regulator